MNSNRMFSCVNGHNYIAFLIKPVKQTGTQMYDLVSGCIIYTCIFLWGAGAVLGFQVFLILWGNEKPDS